MHTLLCLALICLVSCDSLWTGFKEPNPNSCAFTPGVCGPGATMQDQNQNQTYGFSHDDIFDSSGDISIDGRQFPLAVREKLHSCGKIRFNVLTNILKTRGVNVTNTVANSAGALLSRAQPLWGVPNFPARVAETIRDSPSSLVSLHDILLASAEEWVTMANPDGTYPAGTACTGAKLFNNNSCDQDGLACLMGATPTQRQLDVCNSMINDTSAGVTDPLTKRRLALAALAGTVAMCD